MLNPSPPREMENIHKEYHPLTEGNGRHKYGDKHANYALKILA